MAGARLALASKKVKGRWAKDYDKCRICGGTSLSQEEDGLCRSCSFKLVLTNYLSYSHNGDATLFMTGKQKEELEWMCQVLNTKPEEIVDLAIRFLYDFLRTYMTESEMTPKSFTETLLRVRLGLINRGLESVRKNMEKGITPPPISSGTKGDSTSVGAKISHTLREG
jgi:hypothetical protein